MYCLIYCIAELITWYLVYRTDTYQRAKLSIDKLNDQIESLKNQTVPINKQKVHDRKLYGLEDQLKAKNQSLNKSKLISTVVVTICMITLFYTMNKYYYGVSVAVLPFIPISYIQGVTHRGINNDDMIQCSATFIYIVTGMFSRSVLQKALGVAPNNTEGIWAQATAEAERKYGKDYDD